MKILITDEKKIIIMSTLPVHLPLTLLQVTQAKKSLSRIVSSQ